jgi:hypothetical protein
VACNGCTDATPDVARSIEAPIRVIEMPVGDKAGALNEADGVASGFPRFYVDADVVLSLDAVRAVCKALENPAVLAAAPRMRIDLTSLQRPVRAYYRVWLNLPWAKRGPIGSGVYALSREGRARFGRFPDTLAEDAFVDHLFSDDERRCVEEVTFEMRPPRTLGQLIRVLGRRRIGIRQLRGLVPEERRESYLRQRRALLGVARHPNEWPALSIYVGVTSAAMLYSWMQLILGRGSYWTRDESIRGGPGAN